MKEPSKEQERVLLSQEGDGDKAETRKYFRTLEMACVAGLHDVIEHRKGQRYRKKRGKSTTPGLGILRRKGLCLARDDL